MGVLYFGNPDQSYRSPARARPITKELEIVARSLQVELQSDEVGARVSLSAFARNVGKGVCNRIISKKVLGRSGTESTGRPWIFIAFSVPRLCVPIGH